MGTVGTAVQWRVFNYGVGSARMVALRQGGCGFAEGTAASLFEWLRWELLGCVALYRGWAGAWMDGVAGWGWGLEVMGKSSRPN